MQGLGKQKNLEIRVQWLQEALHGGLAQVRCDARDENIADIMTHSHGARKVAKLNDVVGLNRLTKEECDKYTNDDGRSYRAATKGCAAHVMDLASGKWRAARSNFHARNCGACRRAGELSRWPALSARRYRWKLSGC